MADLLISPLVEGVLDKLTSELWKELKLLGGVKKDIGKLHSKLSSIQAVLEDVEQRPITEKSLLDLLKKLKDAAYDADDVADELQIEALRAKARGHFKQEVCDFFSSHNPVLIRHRIALKIKEALERLKEIEEEKTYSDLAHNSIPAQNSALARNEESHSVVVASDVYGRNEDREKIVNHLLSEDIDKELSVIAIVGLGGVGKTTLAQLVYKDERIESSFDLKAWVFVSNVFDVKEITKNIIKSINTEANCSELGLNPLGQLLRGTLHGKRFIIVLDDVWNENPQKWENLKSLLRCGENGSTILVTTRSEDVASVMNSIFLHRLGGLLADDCWRLFRERAFGFGRQDETPRFIEIGKKIVSKGGGLPLAAKALGSLMGSKSGVEEWLAIENNDIWSLHDDEDNILPALRLSYYDLPYHVRKCFVYCSVFHKDYVYSQEKLINLWLGEGFIQSSSKGSQYFNSLLRRSFFDRVVEINYIHGEFVEQVNYKMHDVIHELACSVGKDEVCRIEVREDEVKVLDNCRYLSLSVDHDMSERIFLRFSCETKKIRSFLLIKSPEKIDDIAWDTLLQLDRIRLLDLSDSGISMLPSTLWRLKHMRFLNLSGTRLEKLPPTIRKMYNLSTLILRDCMWLKELPSTLCSLPNLSTLDLSRCYNLGGLPGGMSKMNSLIHLDIWGCDGLRDMPPGMGRLRNLETMPKFFVGEEDGRAITELKHLNQIRGRLQLWNLHKVKSPAEAKEANLRAKIHVKELELRWGRNEGGVEEESIIENLCPPPYVEALKIEGYHGRRVPSWWMQKSSSEMSVPLLFRSLVRLELSGLKRCEGLPTLGHLPFLNWLVVSGMEGVRRIGGEEFYGHTEADAGGGGINASFSNLEFLRLGDMPNLEEWAVEAGEIPREAIFPCLRELEIMECPKLRVVGFGLPMSLVDLNVYGRTELSARCFAGLSRLRDVTISMSAAALTEGCLRYLTALETLRITGEVDGPATTCLPDGMVECHIPSLQTLKMVNLRSLTSLGAGDLHQQQRWIQPPPLFTSLCVLELFHCDELTVLPEWLGCLTSLQTLHLEVCPKLEMLPDGLQHLTALQILCIGGCPLLEPRCVRETGEDWHKISHIPSIPGIRED